MKSGPREWGTDEANEGDGEEEEVSLSTSGRGFCAGDGCRRVQHGFDCEDEANGVSHSRVPGSRARHLRSVVGNDDAVEMITLQNRQDAHHIHLALIDVTFSL